MSSVWKLLLLLVLLVLLSSNSTFAMKIVDPKTGEERQITVSADDGIRPNTSLAGLAQLKPAFKKDGSTTAGINLIL